MYVECIQQNAFETIVLKCESMLASFFSLAFWRSSVMHNNKYLPSWCGKKAALFTKAVNQEILHICKGM